MFGKFSSECMFPHCGVRIDQSDMKDVKKLSHFIHQKSFHSPFCVSSHKFRDSFFGVFFLWD